MNRFFLITIAGALSAGGLHAQAVREGSYWVELANGVVSGMPVARLKIVTIGGISVRGDDTGGTSYVLKKRVRTRSQAEAKRLFDSISISSHTEGEWTILTVRAADSNAMPELAVKTTKGLQELVLDTQAGGIEVYDVNGLVRAESRAGAIQMDRIGGSVKARTGGGEIRLGKISGWVKCFSAAGSIRVDSAGGDEWLETEGGNISIGTALGLVHATTAGGNIQVERASASVEARTAGGLIDVQKAGGHVTAETSSGSIQIGAAKDVRCDSAAGGIRVKSVSGSLKVSTARGTILAELVAGSRLENSSLDTGGGDVIVLIPSNLAVSIRAQSDSTGPRGRIVSDFPEIRLKKAEWPGGDPVVAEGMLNGGGPTLKVTTSGGTIYLRRQK